MAGAAEVWDIARQKEELDGRGWQLRLNLGWVVSDVVADHVAIGGDSVDAFGLLEKNDDVLGSDGVVEADSGLDTLQIVDTIDDHSLLHGVGADRLRRSMLHSGAGRHVVLRPGCLRP